MVFMDFDGFIFYTKWLMWGIWNAYGIMGVQWILMDLTCVIMGLMDFWGRLACDVNCGQL